MRIKFWGVRGSIPTPLSTEQLQEKLFRAISGAQHIDLGDPAAVKAYIASLPPPVGSVVGGNTTCVEITSDDDTLIIDAGSGMRPLGFHLMTRAFGTGQGTAHIFLTHAHWDHLQGFPFFLPAYVPGNRLIFYAVNYNPQRYLEHQQVAPLYFPVPTSVMRAEKEFIQLREGEAVRIGRLTVTSLALYHPGTAYAYRFEDGESVFVFASDGEYKSLAENSLRRYIDFFTDADALVFDSQYSLRDVFFSRADWGHSSAIIGVDIAERARVKKLITFHHEPTHTDDQIHQIAETAREYATVNELNFRTEVIVGMEGLELHLGQPPRLEVTEAQDENECSLALAGYLTQASAHVAQEQLQATLARAQNGRVLLDLTALQSLDAVGVKALLDAYRVHAHVRLAVLAPDPHIRRVLEGGGAEALKIFRSRQQALTALSGPEHLQLASATIGAAYEISDLWFADESGVIYRGTDRRRNEPVLVGVVPGQAHDPARLEFTQQVEAWKRVKHASLLPGRAVLYDAEWVAFICPRPEGLSLREWRIHKPTLKTAWLLAEQIAQAVAAMHAEGVVHGGLRPEKLVVNGNGVQVAPIALFPHPPGFGPNVYRAPEQLRGYATTPRTDVYLLGLILYEVLLGLPAFAAESDELRLTMQLYGQPQNPRAHWPEIPEEIEAVILRMLAAAPEDRFASGEEAAQAIRALSGLALSEQAPGRRGTGPFARPVPA